MDVLIQYYAALIHIMAEVYDGRVSGREGVAVVVNCDACEFLGHEIMCMCGATVRTPLEKAYMEYLMVLVKASCPKARYQELLPLLLEATESDDAVVASAACIAITDPLLTRTGKECIGTSSAVIRLVSSGAGGSG